MGAILLILDPFLDDVGSILESFLTFSKSYLKAHVFCVFPIGDAPPFGGLPGHPRCPLERSKSHTETPEVAKFTFCHQLVFQCPNFIHHVFSLVLRDLFFI